MHQLALVAILSCVTFMLLEMEGSASALITGFDTDLTISFFSSLSEALAGLLGLLIAFLLFTMERTYQEVNAGYQTLNAEIRELARLASERPSGLEDFDDDLARTIDSLAHSRGDRIVAGQGGSPLAALVEKLEAADEGLSRQARLHARQVMFTLRVIQQTQHTISIQHIAAVGSGLMIQVIVKLALLIGAALALMLLFGATPHGGTWSSIKMTVIAAILVWVFLILVELVIHTQLLYRDLRQGLRNRA